MTKNTYLTNVDNKIYNAGVSHILRHSSVAVKRFGGRYANKAQFYSDKIGITYNQWQENLVKYKKNDGNDMMTHKDLARGTTFEQMIPLTEHGCVSDLISHQIMKRAMSSPERMIDFVADKIEIASSRGAWQIDQVFITDITSNDNYREKKMNLDAIVTALKSDSGVSGKTGYSAAIDNAAATNAVKNATNFAGVVNAFKADTNVTGVTDLADAIDAAAKKDPVKNAAKEFSTAIFELEEKEFKPGKDGDGTENIRKLNNSVTSTTSVMRRPTRNFNRLGLISSSMNCKQIGIVISDEMHGRYEDSYGHTFNLAHTELGRRFAWVEVLNIHEFNRKHLISIDEYGYVMEIDEESPTGWDLTREAFLETWYYKWIYAFQAVALGRNIVSWGVKP